MHLTTTSARLEKPTLWYPPDSGWLKHNQRGGVWGLHQEQCLPLLREGGASVNQQLGGGVARCMRPPTTAVKLRENTLKRLLKTVPSGRGVVPW